ncbi:MAG: lysine-2,3-aminomutase-like protein [Beijerinckiaceae bacterium]|nr:lysine-2,3-aminomutase-like protein [Beijerinckiaceae bacterium]
MSARSLTRLEDLAAAGLIPAEAVPALEAVAERYAVAVTPDMARLIGSPDDPIGRQFLPRPEEAVTLDEESPDPIGDHAHSPVKGLVHRYPDRVLIKITHSCPVYCRFCFRREMVGPAGDGTLTTAELDAIGAYLAGQPGVREVIVTGGDPLMLSARRIRVLGERLAPLSHVRLVRWHSRVPVVAPGRITPELASALAFSGKANYVAVHANHAREFTPEAAAALARLHAAGIVLLGQSVLLQGVNASEEALLDLFATMLAHRIVPLYLHHPDLAPGTGHFRMSLAEGQALYGRLRGRISGPGLPAYVLDLPGGHGKVEIGPDAVIGREDGVALVRDSRGQVHRYPEG